MLLGHITGHWEPEFFLFAWGFKYLFSASNANQFITGIKCSFLDVFVDILSLTVKIDLPLQSGPEWGHFSAREFQAQDRPTFSMVVEIG